MRKAFTLIELVISIVIIGIASATIPMMMSSANKLQAQTINQDIFFKSTTVMNDILSKYWDTNVGVQDNAGNGAMVVDTGTINDDVNLRRNGATATRIGSFARGDYDFRRFYPAAVSASAIPAGTTILTNAEQLANIEDYNGRFIDETAGSARVRYDISVRYVGDKVDNPAATTQTATWSLSGGNTWTAAADSTNLKRITITATRTGFDPISFSYFSSNIGTPGAKSK